MRINYVRVFSCFFALSLAYIIFFCSIFAAQNHFMAKQKEIIVKDTTIRSFSQNGWDFICITDIARQKNAEDPNAVVGNWMRNRNTIEYLGIWEALNNPNFNPLEFEGFRSQAGLNAFTLSPSRWIEATNAIGLIAKSGRYGGTYAQRDIAFKFASWVSVEFELYLIKEFQRLKEEEQKALGWSAKRELAKINYHIHTDAIKEHLIPQEIYEYHLENPKKSQWQMSLAFRVSKGTVWNAYRSMGKELKI